MWEFCNIAADTDICEGVLPVLVPREAACSRLQLDAYESRLTHDDQIQASVHPMCITVAYFFYTCPHFLDR